MSLWFHMQAIRWNLGFGRFGSIVGIIFTFDQVINGIRELNYLPRKIDHTWGHIFYLRTDPNVTFTSPECVSPFDLSTFHIHRPHAQSHNISSVLWDHLSRASPIGEGVTHHRSCLDEIWVVGCCVTLAHFMDWKIRKLTSTLIQRNRSRLPICLPSIMTLGTCSRFSVISQKCRGNLVLHVVLMKNTSFVDLNRF